MPTFILFESATGYSLFKVRQLEVLASSMRTVQSSLLDYRSFRNMARLVTHLPFDSSEQGVINMTSIAQGELPDLLATFLETNLGAPSAPSSRKTILGVIDRDLARQIATRYSHLTVDTSDRILEATRGIRIHFASFLRSYTASDVSQAQLGLGHAFCRAKLKMDINKADQMIIQSSSVVEFLDRDINQCCMRIKEWYSWHFPELGNIIKDNKVYVACVMCVGDRRSLSEEAEEEGETTKADRMKEILFPWCVDKVREERGIEAPAADVTLSPEEELFVGQKVDEVVGSICEAASSSMGSDIGEMDHLQVERFAGKIERMLEYRGRIVKYVTQKMEQIAPNLTTLVGEGIGAKLITKAGSLLKLAKLPSSTIQILGAEKALFRALKTRGKTPKYGILYNASFVSKATRKNKGRMARHVANKAALCSRIDCFGGKTSAYGEVFKKQLEQKVWFYEGNTESPFMKNFEVMAEAKQMAQVERDRAAAIAAREAAAASKRLRLGRRRKKKVVVGKKRPRVDPDEEPDASAIEAAADAEELHPRKRRKTAGRVVKRKRKKRKRVRVSDPAPPADVEIGEVPSVDQDGDVAMDASAGATTEPTSEAPARKPRRRRRRKKTAEAAPEAAAAPEEAAVAAPVVKKRRRRKKRTVSTESAGGVVVKKRRKRRKRE